MIKTAILTISDTRDKNQDLSGRAIRDLLDGGLFQVCEYDIVHDEESEIKDKLIRYADVSRLDLVLTNGGTGLGPRDITPEATRDVLEKEVPGISELMRIEGLKKTNRAVLSRGIAGVRKNTLIINLPGSPKGARESLEVVLGIIPHALDMLKGMGH